MFTGIIEYVAQVQKVTRKGSCCTLAIRSPYPIETVQLGESIALSGVCLTVSRIEGKSLLFYIQRETLDKTYFSHLKPSDYLNVERAMNANGRFGGHIVQGHVDQVGVVLNNEKHGDDWVLTVGAGQSLLDYIVPKCSVAIDGISLTVVEKRNESFTVHIVPHTLSNTNLRYKKTNDKLNIETDILGKYVYNFISKTNINSDQSLWSTLKKGGFIQ